MNKAEFKRQHRIARLVIRALPYFLENNLDSVAKHTLLLNISPIVLPTIKSLDLYDYDEGFFTTNKRFLSVTWVTFRNNRFYEKYVNKCRFKELREKAMMSMRNCGYRPYPVVDPVIDEDNRVIYPYQRAFFEAAKQNKRMVFGYMPSPQPATGITIELGLMPAPAARPVAGPVIDEKAFPDES